MRRITRAPLLAGCLALVVAACGGPGTPSPAPTPAPPTDVPGSGDRTPVPTPGLLPGQAWGAAWDTLPPGFPVPAGAKPADPGDPADGPVGGAFVADGTPADVATSIQKRAHSRGLPYRVAQRAVRGRQPGDRHRGQEPGMPGPGPGAPARRNDDDHGALRGILPWG